MAKCVLKLKLTQMFNVTFEDDLLGMSTFLFLVFSRCSTFFLCFAFDLYAVYSVLHYKHFTSRVVATPPLQCVHFVQKMLYWVLFGTKLPK